MRHFDISPYYRSTVGFDRVFNLLDNLVASDAAQPSYPPYNIERTSDDAYGVTMAVAGFAEGDLSIEVKENVLTVKGAKAPQEDEGREILHRGIATRAFERKFQLADYVEVAGASLKNGLLHIDLERHVPDAMKARTIAITNDGQKQISAKTNVN